MKKIISIGVFVVFLAGLPVLGAIAQDAQGGGATFETERAWGKLDSRTQKAWLGAKSSGDMSTRLDCFVRVKYPADAGDRTFLESQGYVVRAFSGTIASGHLAAKDMQAVAELPFVESVKLSTKGE